MNVTLEEFVRHLATYVPSVHAEAVWNSEVLHLHSTLLVQAEVQGGVWG